MRSAQLRGRRISTASLALVLLATAGSASTPIARADHSPDPTSVTLAGDLQGEITSGACSDWQQDCAASHLADHGNGVWRAQFAVPAGTFEYKMALDDAWDQSYAGTHQSNGNTSLGSPGGSMRFYYDHKTHAVLDSVMDEVAVAAGSFQSELGCPDDWQPWCVRSLLTDADGDGVLRFATTAIPTGDYEFKVALDEAWSESHPANNVPFTVPAGGGTVSIALDAARAVSVQVTPAGSGPPAAGRSPNDVEWDGLRHDSRSDVYRTPGGAVEAGTPVTIRFRTFHDDVTGVRLRLFDVDASGQSLVAMERVATGIGCYQANLTAETCDFWSATVDAADANNFWYRFIVSDGTDADFYADDTPALDGGRGAPSDEAIDQSWALTVHEPDFRAPRWADDAVIYQIFPDRFRNGTTANDAQTGDERYDDPAIALPWGTAPEGFCRNYAAGDCPWRFDDTPPDSSPTREQPRGRDYMGGDLQGVIQKLGYLESIGVDTIYFNPIFEARSNHRYDTADYYAIDRYLGTNETFRRLVREAREHDIRIVLDGVFNHLSSDSSSFDRYHHDPGTGACESPGSLYRPWFTFRAPAGSEPSPCAPSTPGGADTYYDGWFGFDSIPVIDKTEPAVQEYFLTGPDSVTRHWLRRGAAGWRMDVMGDASFPARYWETFRDVVKDVDRERLIISETWQKDTTLLRMIRGDRADTTMNYRLRDAVLGLLAPTAFDPKGFADSGDGLTVQEFASRIESIEEDYAPAAYRSLMNLLDSHDTERLLWTLTPGPETTAGRELDTANVAEGKRRLRLASLIQFTLPGAPTVYYGDEAGVTGDDDPDDRRTYPWADTGGAPDAALISHYRKLAQVREQHDALTDGDVEFLLKDQSADTLAYGLFDERQAAVVALNRSTVARTLAIPLTGHVPDGTRFRGAYGVGTGSNASATVSGGDLTVALPPLSALVLATGRVDLEGPDAVDDLIVTDEGTDTASLDWGRVRDARGYHVYRSRLTGGGFERVTASPVNTTAFTDTGLDPGALYFYVVRAVDRAGNVGEASNEVSALPHYEIGWANLQWPPSMTHTVSVTDCSDEAYGQVWIDGVTSEPGPTDGLRAQLGFGPDGSDPAGDAGWTWIDATFNVDAGNNDEFRACMKPEAVGDYDYLYRYTTTGGRDWTYADLRGPIAGAPADPGDLTVVSSGDTTEPAVPTGLVVTGASPVAVDLDWDDVAGDPSLYGYEVRRSDSAGGPYTTIALVTESRHTDTGVAGGATYHYVVRAVDQSFNRSGDSSEVTATAAPRTVTLVFDVTVPPSTDGTGRVVHIAGFLDRLDGDLPQWDPAGVELTRVDGTHWTITLSGREGTQIEYKYTLGDWEHVEKDGACGEIGNRMLTLAYGTSGTQTVADTVPDWRNVAPCGN